MVKPAYENFIGPTMKYADIIIQRVSNNNIAIDILVQHIQEILKQKSNQNNL